MSVIQRIVCLIRRFVLLGKIPWTRPFNLRVAKRLLCRLQAENCTFE